MQNTQRHHFLFIIIAITTVVAGFWLFNPFPLYFLNDDFIHIPLSKAGALFQRKSFRPVCDISVAFDYFLWKKEAWGYHLTNLLLHMADSALVYVLARIVFKKYTTVSNNWGCIFASILFFVYPFHSEAIFWIIGRSASLGVLFFLPAVIFYFRRNEKPFYFPCSMLFFSVGLMTYESVWVFPFIALGISWLDRKSGLSFFKKEARYIITIVMLFIAFLVIRYAIIGEIAGNYEAAAFKGVEFKNLLLNGVRLMVRSFVPPLKSVVSFYVFTALLLIGFVLFTTFLVKNNCVNKLLITFIIGGLIISYIPYLSLGLDTHGTESERFLYLPSLFVCLLVALFIFSVNVKAKIKIFFSVSVLGYAIFFLYQSQKNYETAGKVTKTTITVLQKLEGKNRLFINSLPEECNGAVIFRSGFYEAVKWMKPLPAFKNIFITSSLPNIERYIGEYKVIYKDASTFGTLKITIPDYNPTSDVLFFYSDSALMVVK